MTPLEHLELILRRFDQENRDDAYTAAELVRYLIGNLTVLNTESPQ